MTQSFSEHPKKFLGILASDVGWYLIRALARSDYRLSDLTGIVGQSQEVVADILAALHDLQLITKRQSDAHAHEVFYRLELQKLRDLYLATGMALHPALGGEEQHTQQPVYSQKRVLFLCTGNSARSQIAEGLLRYLSQGKVEAYSAGTKPSQVHPLAIRTMANIGIDISQQYSKHLTEYIDQSFDYVITVCDHASETCPTFPGNPSRLHWGFADPVTIPDEEEQARAFRNIATQLGTMIRYFLIILERENRKS